MKLNTSHENFEFCYSIHLGSLQNAAAVPRFCGNVECQLWSSIAHWSVKAGKKWRWKLRKSHCKTCGSYLCSLRPSSLEKREKVRVVKQVGRDESRPIAPPGAARCTWSIDPLTLRDLNSNLWRDGDKTDRVNRVKGWLLVLLTWFEDDTHHSEPCLTA